MRRTAFSLVSLLCTAALGADVIADFETPQDGVPPERTHDPAWRVCVTNLFASSGTNALYWGAAWKEGLYEYPAVTISVPERLRDWRGYGRLAIDVVSTGEKLDKVFVRLPGTDNWGLTKTFYAPVNSSARFVLPLDEWPKTVDPAQVRRVEVFAERPEDVRLFIDRLALYRPDEPLPPKPALDARSARALADLRGECKARASEIRRRLVRRLRSGMRRAQVASDAMVVGSASSMSRVMPRDSRDAHEEVGSVEGLGVRLARGERESVQLVVTPSNGALRNVRVSPTDMKSANGTALPASALSCEPVGYVKVVEPGRYAVGMAHRRPLPGWYPDPILSFLGSVDVRTLELQSFWIRVTCPESQAAGTYSGHLVISSSDHADVRVPFSVRVSGFALPRASPLPLAVSFNPETWTDWSLLPSAVRKSRERMRADPEAPVNAWKRHRQEWGSFLADYYITMTSLYNGGSSDVNWDVLARLRREGRLGCFNIGYWHPLYDHDLPNDGAAWRAGTLRRIRDNYAKAKENGLQDYAYSYGCDEAPTNLFPAIGRALGRLRKEFPDLTIGTTTYDLSFGTDSPLGAVSFFTPSLRRFTPEGAARARAEGRKVWWYFACDEQAPWPNAFVEGLPIEIRVLMGAMTQRMRPDGFLYYQTAIWNSARPILSGPYTDWVAQSWCGHNGDGAWTAVGPDGIPLPTVRLENFRDGLEDLAYARILESLLEERGGADGDDAWAADARKALEVPRAVMRSMTDYTNDPKAIQAWRDKMADLIEAKASPRRP